MDAQEARRLVSREPPNSYSSSMLGSNSPSTEIKQNTNLAFNSVVTSFSLARPYDSPNSFYNNAEGFNMVSSEPTKKKRGRPRKYGPEGQMGLALSPLSSVDGSAYSNSSLYKGNRGRPLGSGKKRQLEAMGSAGMGFTPHVIVVQAGEDVVSKIMAFSQQGPHAVCILSANGSISNVTLRQLEIYGGTVTYEGRFEILSLSGSFLLTDSGGTRSRSGGLSVSLSGSDGRVMGGGVAGMLIAATPVQVVIFSFIAEEENSKPEPLRREPMSALPIHMVGLGAPVPTCSPTSQGTSSESSEEVGSPRNQPGFGAFYNTGQSIQGMSTYSPIGWGSSHSTNPQT